MDRDEDLLKGVAVLTAGVDVQGTGLRCR